MLHSKRYLQKIWSSEHIKGQDISNLINLPTRDSRTRSSEGEPEFVPHASNKLPSVLKVQCKQKGSGLLVSDVVLYSFLLTFH